MACHGSPPPGDDGGMSPRRWRNVVWPVALVSIASLPACNSSENRGEARFSGSSTPSAMSSAPASTAPVRSAAPPSETSPAETPAKPEPLPPVEAVYPWAPAAGPSDRLDARFRDPPPGFTRVTTERGSFAEFLRSLPLKPEGALVVDHRGEPLYDQGRHTNIAAVVDIDVGTKDLQQCADSVIRMHAEWRYGRGDRDLTYRAVSGQALSYRGYVQGERAVLDGKNIALRRVAAPRKDDHALFRAWLDEVFAWAGTASLERDAKKVDLRDVRGGDFFVMSGWPFGHAVLVLDVAKDAGGRLALLLGQGFMPAQSFHVLRPGPDASPWFVVEPNATEVATPFWRPFPTTSLRRF